MLRPLVRVVIPALLAGVLSLPPLQPAAAASCPMVRPPVGDPFPDCSSQQVLNILPPGNNGLTNAVDEATHTPESHATDQQPMYANLKNVAPNLQAADIHQYYKDASFSLAPGDIERTTTFASHPGTVILWDRFGVPHIYGKTRADTEFGAGYAAARDRLFLMDVLRHIGRSRLSQFIGPSPFAFQEDCTIAQVAGYSEQELTYQANLLPQRYLTPFGGGTTEGQQVVDDGTNYVAGVNAYIDAAKLDPTLMPVEYAALPAGQTLPQHWSPADIVAVAAIVQSIFAVGGGDEVDSWFLYKALVDKFGTSKGFQIWHDLRLQNDAGAPTTLAQPFPYMNGANSDSTTLPGIADLTSRLTDASHYVCSSQSVPSSGPAPAAAPSISLNLPALIPGHTPAMSNALLVDAAHSAGGHPIAVFGPQVGYFIPEILHEEDLHGPGIHARGAAFPGTDIYVELGHGTHYAWSATSAGSDLIDQRLELICNPATPTTYTPGPVDGQFYWYHGSCTHQMYERTDSEQALTSGAAPFPPQVITFHIERTIHGPVVGRGTALLSPFGAVPVAISVERSTWFDELGAAPAFLEWNDPDIIHGARDFLGAAAKETGTFNWFYLDSNDIAYYSSGRLPQRSAMVNPNFISWGTAPAYEWQGFQVSPCSVSVVTPPGPDSTGASTTGATTAECGYTADWLLADGSAQDPHPHAINPPSGFLTNWNNKPAPEWSAADSNFGFGSIYRVMSLTDRVQATLAAGPATPVAIVNDMEDAGSVDLDGSKLVPSMLAVLGPGGKPDERQVLDILAGWVRPNDLGAHRRESASDPNHYQSGNAVAIMDALYPNLVYAIFDPWLGDHRAPGNLYPKVFALKALSNPPGPLGSAYDESSGGWESYVNTVLRQVSGQPINDAYSQIYCGSTNGGPGNLGRCRDALRDALDTTIAQLTVAYGTSDPTQWTCSTNNPPGQCNPKNDYIQFQAVGAQSTDPMHWINRPTFQQVVQFPLP